MELKNPTRSYTWTNNQDQPTMAVLDRVFISTNIDAQYPNINIRSVARLGRDHVPLLIDFGVDNRKKPYLFRFEKWWLSQEDLYHVVEKSWNSPCSLSDPLEVWQFKMKNLRRKLKGWALNINADIKRKRKSLPEEFDLLDVFSELNQLTDLERKRMQDIQEELEDIWKIEETKAKQRSRDRNIKEGDMNTAYFHAICNHKARKKTILSLQGPDGMVTENKEMLGLAVDFYKKIFGYEEKIDIHLDENFWEESDYITAEENNLLEAPLSEEEIKEAVFGSYAVEPQDLMASLFCSTKNFGR